MVYIYHRLKKPSIFDFEHIPKHIRKVLFWIKKRFFPNIDFKNLKEADRPMVLTETIPGPKGKAALNDLALFSIDHHNRNTFANPEKSFLNFFVDPDNNTILDLNIVGLPLGYNNPLFLTKSLTSNVEVFTSNPRVDNLDLFSKENIVLLSELKKELSLGSLDTYLPTDNVNSAIVNLVNLNPKFNHNNPRKVVIAKLGQTIPLPEKKENETNDSYFSRAVNEVVEYVEKYKDSILGLIVEPFTETIHGHLYITESFAKSLKEVCSKNRIAFIVDETLSSLNSGFRYKLEDWKFNSEPDYILLKRESNLNPGIITSKKNSEYANQISELSIFTNKLKNSVDLLSYVRQENILESVIKKGDYLSSKLRDDEKYYNHKYSNVRGQGTYHSFDFAAVENRDNFHKFALNSGVNLHKSGEKSITVRSSLVLDSKMYDSLFISLNNFKL